MQIIGRTREIYNDPARDLKIRSRRVQSIFRLNALNTSSPSRNERASATNERVACAIYCDSVSGGESMLGPCTPRVRVYYSMHVRIAEDYASGGTD